MKLKYISKRLLFALLIMVVSIYVLLSFGRVPIAKAANSSDYLYNCSDFSIKEIYNDGANSYLIANTKRRISSQYAQHMNFTSLTLLDRHYEQHTYSLTLLNGNDNGFAYATREKYSIDNLMSSETDSFIASLYSISNNSETFDLSSAEADITFMKYSTIKWATAYAYIYSEKTGWPWEGNNYLDIIYYSLYVDNVGKINPSQLKSLKFGFKDKNDNWVFINSSYKKNGTKDYHYSKSIMGVSMNVVNVEDAYYYDLSNPSRTDGLRDSFKANMYATENGVDSIYLNYLTDNFYFEDWPSNETYEFDYVIVMEHAPQLNDGLTRNNNYDTDNFGIVQFSYVDEYGLLTGASLYNSSQTPDGEPIIVIVDDITGEEIPYTINPETGDIEEADGYYIDEFGILRDPNNKAVDFDERNETITNPDSTNISSNWFNSLSSSFKKIITIVLLVLGLILAIKLFSLIGNISGKKNNVNINVRSGSNNYKRKRKGKK